MSPVALTPPGRALRLTAASDAASTTTLDLPESFAVSAWVAPAVRGTGAPRQLQGILLGVPASGDRGAGRSWTLGLDRGGHPVLRVDELDRTVVELRGPEPLTRLSWSWLAATLEGELLTLRVDGTTVDQIVLGSDAVLARRQTVHVGRGRDVVVVGAVRYGFFTGMLAGATVGAPTAARSPQPDVDPRRAWTADLSLCAGDKDRPRYHFMPTAGWMNEPHAVIHHAGRHHLFYQRNELGPFWGAITWGHAVSDDLVRWTDVGSALDGADIPYAPDGVWSGSATTDHDGTPLVFFTAGDDRDDPNQRTGWARPADPRDPALRSWKPGPAPVTTLHDALPELRRQGLEPLPREFRDPFVWRDGDLWFQLVGAGIQGRGGTALLFRSPDPTGARWEFVGPLTIGDAAARPDTGVHWELPVLVPVGHDSAGRAKHAFFVTPWWPEPCEHSLLYQWYWVGEWDAQAMTWTPDHDEPRLLDVGGFFTGVTASRTQDGRTLLWTIAQDLLSEEEHARRGWAGNAGLPVEVWFDDGDLRIAPARELKSLRDGTVVDLVAGPDLPLPDLLPVAAGPTAEIEVVVDLPLSGSVEIAVRATSGADPAAVVVVTRTSHTTGRVDVVRPHGREPARQHRVGEDLRLPEHEAVRLHAYLDHSMVEVYVQNHRSVTTRAWAAQGADDSGWVRVAGGARLTSVRVWALGEAVVTDSR